MAPEAPPGARPDEGALEGLRQSALIIRAFGIANPAFAGDEARLQALFERLFLYAREIDREERRLVWRRRHASR
jgi:hypothetical protein